MAQSIQTWTCGNCGKECQRVAVRGARPKWCSTGCSNRGPKKKPGVCRICGVRYIGYGADLCSRQCSGASRRKPRHRPAPKQQADKRGLIRRAYEDGDWVALASAIAHRTEQQGHCHIWQGRIKDGYPLVNIAGKTLSVHRLSLEAKHGQPLGSQAAHHVCATTACVNPDHLQPITHRDNIAEMMARRSYIARIAELEDALRELAPEHHLLGVVAVV